MQNKGIVDLYPNEIINIVEPKTTKLNHLGVVTLSELEWQNTPASFMSYIEAVKTPISDKNNFVLTEDDELMLTEDGYRILI